MRAFLFIAAIQIDTSPLPKAGSDPSLIIDVLNVVFGVLAALALITVVYGGFKYVLSRGEPDKIGKAKDIILYSLIGLVISFSAFGIVNLLLKALL